MSAPLSSRREALRSSRSARSLQRADPTGKLRRAAAEIAGSSFMNRTRKSNYDPSYFSGGKEAADEAMRHAIDVTPRRIIDEQMPGEYRRLVARNIQIPQSRTVKVPVRTTSIKPVTSKKRVKVKRLVEVPAYKTVEEEYTEVKHREEYRDKEVWVKKVVKEKFLVPYSVKKTRTKKIPTTELQEVEEWEDVEVTEDTVVSSRGFRVDEVQDLNTVEVEEEELYKMVDMVPQLQERRVVGTRDIVSGRGPRPHYARKLGDRTYSAREVEDIPLDPFPSHRDKVPAAVFRMRERLGMVLHYNLHDTRGLLVKTLRPRGPAEKGGIRRGDYIRAVDGSSVHSLGDFRAAVERSGERVEFSIDRDGSPLTVNVTKAVLSTARGARSGADTARSVMPNTWQRS